ncbi:MAG: general stress protein [Thermomicrobiales bacterium]
MATVQAPASTATKTMQRTVVGVFQGSFQAEQALNNLKDAGFTAQQVSIIAKDTRATKEMAEATGVTVQDTGIGAVGGGILGGVAGWLLGVSALTLPVVGEVIGIGILWATLAGAGIGIVAGGLVGALVGHGVDEDHAREYQEHVRQGGTLVTIHADNAAEALQARMILDNAGGTAVRSYGPGEEV